MIDPGFGDRIRAARERAGFSLDTLASKARLSKTGLWQIEKEDSRPNGDTLATLARRLGVSMDQLAFAEPQRPVIPEPARRQILATIHELARCIGVEVSIRGEK